MQRPAETKSDDFLRFPAARRAAESAFGRPLVTNTLRGLLVEAIIAQALEPDWTWCGEDYAPYDFINSKGIRLQVKQSAARQSWDKEPPDRPKRSFDIRARIGRYEGKQWIAEESRNCDLYIFAYHPVTDERADHRREDQWLFFVFRESGLPTQKASISIARLSAKTGPVGIGRLKTEIANCLRFWP